MFKNYYQYKPILTIILNWTCYLFSQTFNLSICFRIFLSPKGKLHSHILVIHLLTYSPSFIALFQWSLLQWGHQHPSLWSNILFCFFYAIPTAALIQHFSRLIYSGSLRPLVLLSIDSSPGPWISFHPTCPSLTPPNRNSLLQTHQLLYCPLTQSCPLGLWQECPLFISKCSLWGLSQGLLVKGEDLDPICFSTYFLRIIMPHDSEFPPEGSSKLSLSYQFICISISWMFRSEVFLGA